MPTQRFLYFSWTDPVHSTCHRIRHISCCAGNFTFPVAFLHRSCTQYMPCDQSHFLYAGNVTYPVLFLHKSCTQYMPYDSHISFMQEMSHILYYFCTDPVHSTCHNYDQAHFYFAGNAMHIPYIQCRYNYVACQRQLSLMVCCVQWEDLLQLIILFAQCNVP